MTQSRKYIPEGLPAVIPQLVVKDARALMDFAARAFGAENSHAMPGPDGKGVMHGMFFIAGAPVFVADANERMPASQGQLFVYVPDVDAAFERATQAGAKAIMPPADMFWGDRWGMLVDAWGNTWQVATNKEFVPPEEMQKRMMASMKQG